MRRSAPIFVALVLLAVGRLAAAGCSTVEPHFQAGTRALAQAKGDGRAAFAAYRNAIAAAAQREGAAAIGKQVSSLAPGRPVPAEAADLASCLLRRYVRARYGEAMVRDLREMVAFRTYAEEGRDNWNAPEFLKQRDWLRRKAEGLGLAFKSYDGRVEEITLPGPPPILAVLTHGDVQTTESQTWSSPPWEGRLLPGGKIVGRGTEDDKGPIVASLYAMAAVRDAGWPLASTLRLLVANGEESSWEEIPYYLERAPMPDMTFGIDAAYPVTHAQKGWGLITFRAMPPELGAEPQPGRWRVVKVTGGTSPSIIPGDAEALLEPAARTGQKERALAELQTLAERWAAAHPPARLAVSREGDLLKVAAVGKSGHSAWPENAHNALGDLTAFLSTLELGLDPWGALATFIGIAVGRESDGAALGLAHYDPATGALTATLGRIFDEAGTPAAQVNVRPSQGITLERIQEQVAERVRSFRRQTGAEISAAIQLPNLPHVAPVDGKLVSTLLAVWREVTGQPGKPVAIGGGTQARLFTGGVDFGPALSMEAYRGHGSDEYLTVDELHRIAELTVAALWRLAGEAQGL